MLDAMEQLLTGSTAGFDEEYFLELMECMALYDIDLPKAQDAAWAGMIEYSDSNGTPQDEWGGCLDTGHCHKYHEQNATTQNFHNMTIYEPCNYASNVAYYHVVTQICKHKDLWNMPQDYVKAILQGFATLAMGSSFWHGSHTYLGNVADNRFIDVIAYVAHQASVSNLPTNSSVVRELSLSPRSGNAVTTTQGLINMFSESPVDQWTDLILALDMPDYFTTFSGLVCTFLTLRLDSLSADLAIVTLMDLFKLPEEQREFILYHYLPELREAAGEIILSEETKLELQGNIESTLIKLIYAFLWQEYVITESPIFLNPIANVIGNTLIKYVNDYANSLSTFPVYDEALKTGEGVYPGSDRCNPVQPHSKWHVESANGLMDLMYLADYIYQITGAAQTK